MIVSTTASEKKRSQAAHAVAFDVHGVLTVHCLNASVHERGCMHRQLGVPEVLATDHPNADITIRFVDKLPERECLEFVQMGECAARAGKLILFPRGGRKEAALQIALDQVGGRCEILCERGVKKVPMLNAIVGLTALRKGVVPLHASAVRWKEQGILVSGWTGGGKTGLMLALAAAGAAYVADDLVLVSPEVDLIRGFTQPIRVKQSYLEQLPALAAKASPHERKRLKLLKRLHGVLQLAAKSGRPRWMGNILAKADRVLIDRRAIDFEPQRLFQGDALQGQSPLDVILITVCHDSPRTYWRSAKPAEIAGRLFASIRNEFQQLVSSYYRHLYAFPECRNVWIESLDQDLELAIRQIVRDKPGFVTYHPYPASLEQFPRVVDELLHRKEALQ